MKKLVVALAALALAAPAFAQQDPASAGNSGNRSTIGLGVAISPIEPNQVAAGSFARAIEVYVPIQIAPMLRFEPSVGIHTNDQPNGGIDTRNVIIGAGLFVQQRVAPAVDLYAGGRLKLNFAHVDTPAGDDSGTDFLIAAAAGGEYYLVPKFSVGLEAQLGYYSNSSVSGDDSGLFTNGLAFLRVYFL
jgi:outer membrane protein with beta-barrel domain